MTRPLCSTATSQPGEPGWRIWTATGPDFERSLELEAGLTQEQVGYYLGTAGVCDLAPPLPTPEPTEPPPPDISRTISESPAAPPQATAAISNQQLVLGGLGLLALCAVALIARWRQKPVRQRPKKLDLGD